MTTNEKWRETALGALRANPLIVFSDAHEARLADPASDVSFDDLEMDSLSRMELSIWLELEFGLEVTDAEIQDIASLDGLAGFLASRVGG